MNKELLERIDIELTGLQSVIDCSKAILPGEDFAEISSTMDVLRDCKAALTKSEDKLQSHIGHAARLSIEIQLAHSLLDDPSYEFIGSDWDYETKLHDKIRALTQQQGAKPVLYWHKTSSDPREWEVVDPDCACEDCLPLYLHPPKPAAQPQVPDENKLAEWLEREMPAGTIIGNPSWWAPRIIRAISAAKEDGKDV